MTGKFFLDNSRQWFERIFDWDKNLTNKEKKWYHELLDILMYSRTLYLHVGIGMGNPGVFQGYLHLYPRKPIPVPGVQVLTGTGTGSTKTWGYATRTRVCPRN